KAQRAQRDAMAELNEYGEHHLDIVNNLDPALRTQVENFLRLGASVSLVAKAFSNDLSPEAVKAVDAMIKATDKYEKQWESTQADIDKLWDEALMTERERNLKGLDLTIA